MVWWLGRPSHRTIITDSNTAVGIGVVVSTALNRTTITDSNTSIDIGVLVRTALTPHYSN